LRLQDEHLHQQGLYNKKTKRQYWAKYGRNGL
jgi:hypothetical protein